MITVKQLQYRIGATNDSFRRVMDDTIRRANQMDSTLKRGIATIVKYGAAFSAMASGVMYAARRLVNDTTASATQIQKFAERSGVAAESLQALGYAAEQNFTSLEQLGAGLTRLARRTAEAAQGNMAYARSYEQMGISIRNKDGTIRNVEALFLDIAEAFESITDEGERARIAFNLFGDSGYELLPLLSQGRKAIEALAEEAYGLGRVLSQENIERFAQYDAAVTKFRSSMQGVRNQLAISIIPIFNALANGVTNNVHKVTDWISENRTLIAQAVLVSAGLVGIALALGTLVAGFTLATKAIGVVISILGFLLSPLGLVLLASGALYTAWNANWLGMRDAVQEFWKGAKSILDSVVEWEKRVIKTVWEWTISGLDWISTEFIPWLKGLPQTIRHTLSWVVNGLADLREAAAIAVDRTVAWTVNLARGVWASVSDWIDRGVTWTVSLARGAYDAVADWFDRSVTWTVNFVRGAVDAVVGWGERAVTWTVNLARGVWDSVSDWIDRGVTWTVNLVRGTVAAVSAWGDRAVTWTVNLVRGTAEAVAFWVNRTLEWTVNLVRGTASSLGDWIDGVVVWTVNLARGAYTSVADWIGRSVQWTVDLVRGASASVVEWAVRTVTWAVDLSRGTAAAVAEWVDRSVTWTVDLVRGGYEAVADWIDRSVAWTVSLVRGASTAVSEWVDRRVSWTVNLVRGASSAVSDWLNMAVNWTVNLLQGSDNAVVHWVGRALSWTVNLVRGNEDAVQGWVGRAVVWTVELVRGASEAVAEWVNRSVTWTVTLVQGASRAVAGWVDRSVTWTVTLAQGSYEAVRDWIDRSVTWTVALAQGAADSVAGWISRSVTWTVNLAQGAVSTVADWIDRSVTWTVNLASGASRAVAEWIDRSVTWTVNLAQGAMDAVSGWTARTVTWTVDLVRGAWSVVAEWIDRSVTWTVNLARGTAEAVGAWVGRSVTWTVNLVQGAAQAVAEWIDRSVTWTVTLAQGVATAVVEWIDRRITWVVDLARGASASVADWVDRAVSWTVNLVRGTSRAVADWLQGSIDWTINLAKVVASPVSKAAQWLLGWLEGDSAGTVQMTAEGEVALNLREAAPGWGTTLEQWLQERLDRLMWSEITEERFNELTEELGDQADEFLRRVDDKFYQATPHKIEMAADFVLNIGTGVVTFIVGRTLYSGLTAALGALMSLLGFVPGWIASLGVAGFIWPIAVAGAIALSMVATFKALPEETQENLETFLNTGLVDVLKAAGGAIGAIVLGVGVGASGVVITLAAVLAFSIGLVKWEWVVDKATDLWDSFVEWAKGVHDWLPGQPGYIRYPIQIIFQLLGLTFEDDIQDLPLEKQLEQALAKLEDEVRTYARLQASLEDAHPQARGYIQKAILESRERANAYAEEVNRLRALIQAENERSGQASSPGMERLERLVGGPRLSEEDILALGTGNREALLERLSTVRGALDDVEIAGDDAARAIAQVVDAIVAPDKHAHLRKHIDVLAEMATRLVAIGEAKGAPLTMAELADVMALLLSETSTLLGNAEAMQNPLRVTSAGYEELNRRGIELINTTEGLNRNLEAGLELFRLYSRLYGDATHAAGAYMLPGKAYRGAWDEPFYGPGTDIHGLTARDKMNAFDRIRDAFVFGGEAVSKAWSEGILLGESDIEQAADYVARIVKLRWSGESPPPLGPLSDIDEGGKRIVEAWADGLWSARHRVEEVAEQLAQLVADYLVGRSPAKTGPLSEADTGARNIVASFTEGFLEGFKDLQDVLGNAARGIFNLIRTLFTSVFTWIRNVLAEHFPEIVEAFDKMMAEIEAGLEGIQRTLFADDAADDKGRTVSEQAQQWARSIVTSLSDAIAYGRNLGDVFDNLARQIASMIIQAKILGPLMQWLRLPEVLDAIPTFHAGGMIEAQTASVMHTGGVVGGLAHNERLIIGEVGERVLSRAQNDKFERMLEEGMGSGKVDVTVLFQAVDAESFVSLARRNPQAITSVVVDNIMRNGEIRKLIQAVRG